MKLSDLDYALPKEKIALFPAGKRADAKLLCVDKVNGRCTHRIFRDLPKLLNATDLLVLNNTKVLPARLFGKKQTGGKVEALLLKELGDNTWEALLKPGGRVQEGTLLLFERDGLSLEATVLDSLIPGSGKRRLRFSDGNYKEKLWKLGHIPLPPYIDRRDLPEDREQYQTVFAKEEGAVAAPTAGLHFDTRLLSEIEKMGIEIGYVTLHVSYGTFQPITVEDIRAHRMFEEEFEIPEATAQKINQARREKRRVIVCGTTCVRALESAVSPSPLSSPSGRGEGEGFQVKPGKGKTSIFIYPPYDFKVTQGLITNFHTPKSTLLAMVAAFLGYEKMMAAYRTALENDYRFASYGDAMLIV